MVEQIVIFGGWKRWTSLSRIDHGVKEDALWRSTPRRICELSMSDVFERTGELLPGAPPALEPEHRNTFELGGTQCRDRNSSGQEMGTTWPALGEMYAEDYREQGRYRTGGREISPELKLPQTTSLKEQWLEANDARREDRRIEKMNRATQSDSAIHVTEGRPTGNSALPTSRQAFESWKRHDVQTYQLLVRGGMMARTWLRMGIKAEGWGSIVEPIGPFTPCVDKSEEDEESWEDVNTPVRRSRNRAPRGRGGLPVEESLPGDPLADPYRILQHRGRGNTRCGAQDTYEVTNRMRVAQIVYNSKMEYAKTTRKIEILLSSLSQGEAMLFGRLEALGVILPREGCRRLAQQPKRRAG